MHSVKLLAAAAAFASYVIADNCEDVTIKDANPTFDCQDVDGDVTVDEDVAGELVINGLKQIKGDFIINNVTGLLSVSSPTINSIGGKFQLQDLNGLNRIQMDALREVEELELLKLTSLRQLSFGNEELEASSVSIQDTWVSDLSGLKLATVDTLIIDNNSRLNKFDSALVNVTERLYINNNAKNMEVSMDMLENAKEVQIRNVKSFSVPKLETVDASLKFDECQFKSFSAPNVTKISQSLAFINNVELTNVSMPQLKSVGADLRIVNNTEYKIIDGFPKLETCASINLGGSFTEMELPSLDSVKGATVASTTSKNDTFCNFFDENSDKLRVEAKCTYDNENANQGGDAEGGTESSGGSGSGDEDAAGMVSVNTALVGLGLLAGLVQLL